MKTKGLNFMEAIAAMKEGKKIRRPEWGRSCYWYEGTSRHIMQNQDNWTKSEIIIPSMYNIEATDWMIVDSDENWNLSEHINYTPLDYPSGVSTAGCFGKGRVKKCRDLIIKDLKQITKNHKEDKDLGRLDAWDFEKIINKRFGDLK